MTSATSEFGATLELRSLSKRYGDQHAVRNIDLSVGAGEFLTLLGPSGSGKTTTLNLVAGFTTPTAGSVHLGGQDLTGVPAYRRGVGVVFQDYLLFPHMTVQENIEFPLRQRKTPAQERANSVHDILELVGLEGFADRRPSQLSGGQQQRVALARALVFHPSLLLLDEPLGALDKGLRDSLQLELKRLHREVGATFVNVTHDQQEALVLSDRIAVFNHGEIEQVGRPSDLYERPMTEFVARFLGESNCFSGALHTSGSGVEMRGEGFTIRVSQPGLRTTPESTMLIRPEKVMVARVDDDAVLEGPNRFRGKISEAVYLGSARRLEIDVERVGRMVALEQGAHVNAVSPGDVVLVSWKPEDAWVIPDHTGAAQDVLSA